MTIGFVHVLIIHRLTQVLCVAQRKVHITFVFMASVIHRALSANPAQEEVWYLEGYLLCSLLAYFSTPVLKSVHHVFLRCGVGLVLLGAPAEWYLLNTLFQSEAVNSF